MPTLSSYFATRFPSDNRLAQIVFSSRTDGVQAVNVSVGNVSLPMHPAMRERVLSLGTSSYANGVLSYSPTVGLATARKTVLHLIASSGCSSDGLYVQVTDGGSQAMELMLLGITDSNDRPLLVISPLYTNYELFAKRVGRRIVSVTRHLDDAGVFVRPDMNILEDAIEHYNPCGILIIPYDNPTGDFMTQEQLISLAQLCVKHDLWLVSDEAYRELAYATDTMSSVWKLDERCVPGITGRRITIESASKVWNACGLRIGALVTDNSLFHEKAVAEQTANLCANVLGQYIFSALLDESYDSLQTRYTQQRTYYKKLAEDLCYGLLQTLPGVIVSDPASSLYLVIDVRRLVDDSFSIKSFTLRCAKQGSVIIDAVAKTLLVSPMEGFYSQAYAHLGRTQMRIALVLSPEAMKEVPVLLAGLLQQYCALEPLP